MIRNGSPNSLSTDSDEFFCGAFVRGTEPAKKLNVKNPQLQTSRSIRTEALGNYHTFIHSLSGTANYHKKSDSNKPTLPSGYGRQEPIIPFDFIDLNLPINLFKVTATVEIVRTTEDQRINRDSPSRASLQKFLQCRHRRWWLALWMCRIHRRMWVHSTWMNHEGF